MKIEDDFILVCSIVQENLGHEVLRIAYDLGISGATVLRGKGSVQSKFLNFLGMDDLNKEICINVMKKEKEDKFYDELNGQLKFDQPHHGLIFSIPVIMTMGLRNHEPVTLRERVDSMGMDAIFTIVENGQAMDVIETAKKAGATGGTIIHGRGSGVHTRVKLFDFEIEPEKEVVIILTPKNETETIANALDAAFDFVNPGHGILFVLDVSKSMGLYQK